MVENVADIGGINGFVEHGDYKVIVESDILRRGLRDENVIYVINVELHLSPSNMLQPYVVNGEALAMVRGEEGLEGPDASRLGVAARVALGTERRGAKKERYKGAWDYSPLVQLDYHNGFV